MSSQTASADPSMEEILASIRRIISDGDENQDDLAKNANSESAEQSFEDTVQEEAAFQSEEITPDPADEDPMLKLQRALFGDPSPKPEKPVQQSAPEPILDPDPEPLETDVYEGVDTNLNETEVEQAQTTQIAANFIPETTAAITTDLSETPKQTDQTQESRIDFSSLSNPVVKQALTQTPTETSMAAPALNKKTEPPVQNTFGQSKPTGSAASASEVTQSEVTAFSEALVDNPTKESTPTSSPSNNLTPTKPTSSGVAETPAAAVTANPVSKEVNNAPRTRPMEKNDIVVSQPTAQVEVTQKAHVENSSREELPTVTETIAKRAPMPAEPIAVQKPVQKAAPIEPQSDAVTPQIETETQKETKIMSSPAQQANSENIHNIVSTKAEVETRDAFKLLSKALMPEGGTRNFEDVVTELLRPMMKEWMDQNFPPLVEKLVKEEIQRLSK